MIPFVIFRGDIVSYVGAQPHVFPRGRPVYMKMYHLPFSLSTDTCHVCVAFSSTIHPDSYAPASAWSPNVRITDTQPASHSPLRNGCLTMNESPSKRIEEADHVASCALCRESFRGGQDSLRQRDSNRGTGSPCRIPPCLRGPLVKNYVRVIAFGAVCLPDSHYSAIVEVRTGTEIVQ
jgi:hypothetical protein